MMMMMVVVIMMMMLVMIGRWVMGVMKDDSQVMPGQL